MRLEQAALNRVVAETRIACTHFDAYRFFAPSVSRSKPPWGSPSHRRRACHVLPQPSCSPCRAYSAELILQSSLQCLLCRAYSAVLMTLQAVSLNTARPTRQQQAGHEQPGGVPNP